MGSGGYTITKVKHPMHNYDKRELVHVVDTAEYSRVQQSTLCAECCISPETGSCMIIVHTLNKVPRFVCFVAFYKITHKVSLNTKT